TAVEDSSRPLDLTDIHLYNLVNQGWTVGNRWVVPNVPAQANTLGSHTYTAPAGLDITVGQKIFIDRYGYYNLTGEHRRWVAKIGYVVSYSGTTLVVNIIKLYNNPLSNMTVTLESIFPFSSGYIDAFKTATGLYPSNSDVWWKFKN